MIREMRERNQEAVENARSARPQAFRKARSGARGRLTLENLERIPLNPSNLNLPSSQGSTRSASSGRASLSDPPLNVPREWGSKGKRSSDWLRRITMDSAGQISGARTIGEVDWLQAASDVPIPSVEDSPLSRRGSTRGTPASSLRRQNDSLERIQASELIDDLDLTNDSFITSTPAVYSKNSALAEIRQREVDIGLEESETAYVTPPVEAPQRRKLSQSRLSITRAKPAANTNSSGWAHPAEQDIPISRRAQKEQTPIAVSTHTAAAGPPSPISLHKSLHTVGTVNRAVKPTIQQSPQRPGHRREDSQDLLRRLSRAASGTPNSGKPPAKPLDPPINNTPEKASAKAKQNTGLPIHDKDGGIDTKKQTSEESFASNVFAQASDRKIARTKAAAQLASQPASQSSQIVSADETVLSATTHLEAKTPIVTGAWVDTPKPAPRQEPTPPHSPAKRLASAAESQRLMVSEGVTRSKQTNRLTQPTEPAEYVLPSSALAAVVDEARRHLGQETIEDLGEATINSLEDLMVPSHEESMVSSEEDTLDLHQALDFPSNKTVTTAGKLREEERQGLRRLSETLRKTERRVREANREAGRAGSRAASQIRAVSIDRHSPGDLQTQCYNCTHLLRTILKQSKEIFCTQQDERTKPTRIGWLLMLLLTWLIAETTMGYVNMQCFRPIPAKADTVGCCAHPPPRAK
jgi:hypothetical protein